MFVFVRHALVPDSHYQHSTEDEHLDLHDYAFERDDVEYTHLILVRDTILPRQVLAEVERHVVSKLRWRRVSLPRERVLAL